ncbi:carboxylate-amine ligase [Desulforegula conservatrix]|uniref:carboxylate-amine ligase n=1 Tax=Desulforegula conservatrix TaxID=153026 RepID=UPI000426BB3E|nr:glutamate-cysteine ligase family protein [Desulforegula conservatrix]
MTYSIFEAVGIEIEYMIVDKDSLSVRPLAEKLLTLPDGTIENEIEMGVINWSNELVSHVIEFKLASPVSSFDGLSGEFQKQADIVNKKLEKYYAMLLPGGMHPFMKPDTDTVLWPYGDKTIYNAYDRIFGCKGHGWSNLQSVHINMPFQGDEEFARLHSSIRLVLPLIPAISSSSPVMEGRLTGFSDTRLNVYRHNQAKIPSIAGMIIPEPVFSESEYRDKILSSMYKDIAPYDPEEILQDEWLNSRGAIARFERNAIEIRLIDTQECPKADISICAFVFYLVKAIAEERYAPFSKYKNFATERLADILFKCFEKGGDAEIKDSEFLAFFGIGGEKARAGDAVKSIYEKLSSDCSELSPFNDSLEIILERNLSSRIVSSLGKDFGEKAVLDTWFRLSESLRKGVLFS